MCHDDDSRPPSPPRVGEVASHGLLTLTGSDGVSFAAYAAEPAEPSKIGFVILPDVRGLHPYYEQLAIRFAEAGFHSVAMDYFGRTLGVGQRDDDFDWQSEIGKVKPEYVVADAATSAARLRAAGAEHIFTVGFCFGGSQSWRLSASDLDLTGCVGFYGRPSLVADVEADIHHPVLLLVAGADGTPQQDFIDFDQRLDAAGKDHTMQIYEGAPHSFFDRSYGEWGAACADAWQQIIGFTERLAPSAAAV
ncbi:MAG: dienelactone hydrolase [Frankiales bacterium]|jgi:carboxymethylenebutenolidase|nr:dienelactone hydrolase [Frankiales bacterium]